MSGKPFRVVVVGAGVGGLAAAVDLARQGLAVTVVERAGAPGGKLREVEVTGFRIDAGPTVFTMRQVFDELFADAGASLDAQLCLRPLATLARHAWGPEQYLDLFADPERSAAAIGLLAGPTEARGYLAFVRASQRMYATLESTYLRAPAGSPLRLARSVGLARFGELWNIRPFATLWRALGDYFVDPRLRQLFGRYATYCGSSPFLCPATLMLVAHVERAGVWTVEGGMRRIADALAALAVRHGGELRYGAEVTAIELDGGRPAAVRLASGEQIPADAVVVNADAAALADGRFGAAVRAAVPAVPASQRSLSALTWTMAVPTTGFPLARHNVFFGADYATEFDDIFRRRQLPARPTVYVCAQDRDRADGAEPAGAERLLVLVNAPAIGDQRTFEQEEIAACEKRTFELLAHCGLAMARNPEATRLTTPRQFDALFPATGGALYGRATHGWRASFQRPGSRSRIPGLYVAGGSAHPGAGVPMAALSGRLAAAALMADLASTSRSRTVAMPGGTSTP